MLYDSEYAKDIHMALDPPPAFHAAAVIPLINYTCRYYVDTSANRGRLFRRATTSRLYLCEYGKSDTVSLRIEWMTLCDRGFIDDEKTSWSVLKVLCELTSSKARGLEEGRTLKLNFAI